MFRCPSCDKRFDSLAEYQGHVGSLSENRSIPQQRMTRNDAIGTEEA